MENDRAPGKKLLRVVDIPPYVLKALQAQPEKKGKNVSAQSFSPPMEFGEKKDGASSTIKSSVAATTSPNAFDESRLPQRLRTTLLPFQKEGVRFAIEKQDIVRDQTKCYIAGTYHL